MTLNDQKRAFSEAWLQAVAAAAGFGMQTGTNPDDQSVDLTIASKVQGMVKNPRLDVQLKCTAEDPGAEGNIAFHLPQNNFDDLRDENVAVPKILVVVFVPRNSEDWMEQNDSMLVLYRCAWWHSLRGLDASGNSTSTKVELPREQILTTQTLQAIMLRLAANQNP